MSTKPETAPASPPTPSAHLSRADRLAAVMADVEERLEREAAHDTAQRQPA